MDEMLKPTRLYPGDNVMLTSVSSPVPSPEHLSRMEGCLRACGLNVSCAPNVLARHAYLAGTLDQRFQDLNQALANDAIKAIFFAWGGKGANQMLPLLDYKSFARRPKIVVGLSDPVSITTALYAKSRVVTFHGPTGVNLSDPNGLAPYTLNSLTRILFDPKPLGELPSYSKWQILRQGSASGHLVGGHLTTIQTLLGTPYEPDWKGKIFFWEEVGRTPRQIDHVLTHFRLRGVLDQIAGMVVGHPLACEDKEFDFVMDIRDMILSVCRDYSFPILFNVDLGHADPKLTLPVGVTSELNLHSASASFAVTESCLI